MLFSWRSAVDLINQRTGSYETGAIRLAAEVRPPAEYLLNDILPNRLMSTYDAKTANMTIRTTMATLMAMDTEPDEGGLIEMGAFNEQTAKIGVQMTMGEQQLREMQNLVREMRLNGSPDGFITNNQVAEALNFLNKVCIQANNDTEEWMKGQVLTTGQLNWVHNGKKISVDYGVPAANFLPQRTGTAAYDQSASVFWSDIKALRAIHIGGISAIIMHPATADAIQFNPANNIVLVSSPLDFTKRVWRKQNPTTNTFTVDAQDIITVITHGGEGEIYDTSNPGRTVKIPFVARGCMVAIGVAGTNGYRVGQGSTVPVAYELGYGHIAPTVEGGGNRGRFARLWTPYEREWELKGKCVENFLPVVEDATKIAVASTLINGA